MNSKQLLLGFLAEKGSGKDTAGDYLVKNYGFKKDSFARPLKDACKILFRLTDNQVDGTIKEKETLDKRWDKTPRQILQFVGTELFRDQVREDFWIYNFNLRYDYKESFAVTDVRFQNEVDCIKKLGGYVVKISRPTQNENKDVHSSELEMNNIKNYDFLIVNDGTLDDFYKKIDDVYVNILADKMSHL
jgi:hypothetical protein